jgi:hypothetical protein
VAKLFFRRPDGTQYIVDDGEPIPHRPVDEETPAQMFVRSRRVRMPKPVCCVCGDEADTRALLCREHVPPPVGDYEDKSYVGYWVMGLIVGLFVGVLVGLIL